MKINDKLLFLLILIFSSLTNLVFSSENDLSGKQVECYEENRHGIMHVNLNFLDKKNVEFRQIWFLQEHIKDVGWEGNRRILKNSDYEYYEKAVVKYNAKTIDIKTINRKWEGSWDIIEIELKGTNLTGSVSGKPFKKNPFIKRDDLQSFYLPFLGVCEVINKPFSNYFEKNYDNLKKRKVTKKKNKI